MVAQTAFLGLSVALRKLDSLARDVVREQRRPLLKVALIIQRSAIQNISKMPQINKAPDSKAPNRHNILGGGISHRFEGGDPNTVEVGVVRGPGRGYAAFVEFGTGQRGGMSVGQTSNLTPIPDDYVHGGGSRRPNSKGQGPIPFMRTAFHQNEDKIVKELADGNRRIAVASLRAA